MPPAPNTDRSPLRRRLLRRGAGLLTVSCLSLLLAACGNRPAQPRKPARGAANASTSLLSPTVKAQLAQSLAAVKAAVAKLHNARGARFWSSPGTYRWVIPAGATALEITADILASVPPRIPPPGERARLAPVLSERARDNGRRGARRKGTPDS